MDTNFTTITEDDFSKISQKPDYTKIEEALIDIGGTGVNGVKYKLEALKAAGWRYDKLVSYLRNAKLATEVFNKIRLAIKETTDKDELLEKLKAASEE